MQSTAHKHQPDAFWNKIAQKYARQPVADPAAYDAKLTRVRALLRAQDRVLEIGCGTGSTALHLAPSAAEIIATDLSRGMIEIAEEKRLAQRITNVRFVRASAEVMRHDAPFDVIMAFSLLHLVEGLPAVLRAVHDQLKPGGLFLSKTVCLGDAHGALRLFVRALGLIGVAPPVTVLNRAQLRNALVRAGFDLVESRFFGAGRLNPFIVAQRPY